MKNISIIVFGDSIAYGASDSQLGGWVNRLRIYLENKDNSDYKVFNLGIPGQVSEEVLDRFDFESKIRFDNDDRKILILAVGINDSQNIKGKNRILIEQFKDNIKRLINKATKITNDIIFVGLTKVDEKKVIFLPWDKDVSYTNEKIVKYDKAIEDICNKNNINYLKMFDFLNLSDLEDGLHPNKFGHKKIFVQVLSKVNELLK